MLWLTWELCSCGVRAVLQTHLLDQRCDVRKACLEVGYFIGLFPCWRNGKVLLRWTTVNVLLLPPSEWTVALGERGWARTCHSASWCSIWDSFCFRWTEIMEFDGVFLISRIGGFWEQAYTCSVLTVCINPIVEVFPSFGNEPTLNLHPCGRLAGKPAGRKSGGDCRAIALQPPGVGSRLPPSLIAYLTVL